MKKKKKCFDFANFNRYVDHQTRLSGGSNQAVEKDDVTDVVMKQARIPCSAIKTLTDWVNSTESTLLSDHVILADLPAMEQQLKRFQVNRK